MLQLYAVFERLQILESEEYRRRLPFLHYLYEMIQILFQKMARSK